MASEQRSNIAFAGGAGITGLPISTEAGQPVVHQQLGGVAAFTSVEDALQQLLVNQAWIMRAVAALLDDANLAPLSAVDTETFF